MNLSRGVCAKWIDIGRRTSTGTARAIREQSASDLHKEHQVYMFMCVVCAWREILAILRAHTLIRACYFCEQKKQHNLLTMDGFEIAMCAAPEYAAGNMSRPYCLCLINAELKQTGIRVYRCAKGGRKVFDVYACKLFKQVML